MKENPRIYIVAGKARSGKSTAAKFIEEIYALKNIKVLNLMYSEYLKNYTKKIIDWDGDERTKPRSFLQQLGDLVRKEMGNDFFVNRLIEDVAIYKKYYNIFTISDARFPNEIEYLKQKYDVVTIYIEHPESNELTVLEQGHITETALNNYSNFDYKIKNDGTIEELKEKIYKIIEEVEK